MQINSGINIAATLNKPALRPFSPRPFVLRLALFSLPLIILAAAIEGSLWRVGETWPVDKALDAQTRNEDAIWMRGKLGQSYMAYKWSAINRRHYRVLAVGSSRVMKFNGKLLSPVSGPFYNTGGMIRNLNDLESFADALHSGIAPKVILLGIDMWWLNPSFASKEGFKAGIHDDPATDWKAHLTVVRKSAEIVQAARKSRSDREMSPLDPANAIGLDATFKHRGFRVDGSLESGLLFTDEKFTDRETPPIAQRVRTGGNRFERATGLSAQRIAVFRRALQKLRGKGITVLTFLPPVANEVVAAMEKEPGQKSVWLQYRQVLPRICLEEKTLFCDASSPARFGYPDGVMSDGIHAMETFHAAILREWLKNPQADAALPGTRGHVEALLASPKTNLWYPDYSAAKL